MLSDPESAAAWEQLAATLKAPKYVHKLINAHIIFPA